MLIFYLLCYAAVLKFLTYYAQYYANIKELCLKSDCFIRIYLLILIIYLIWQCFIRVYQVHNKYSECSIRAITSVVYSIRVYRIFLTKHFLLCWHYA